ncbi:MAG TPA: sigma-70 family RNA polymerase sigma factor [Gemmatimonadaceae bacterium]
MEPSSRNTDALSAALEDVVARFAKMVRSVGARHGLSDADLDDVLQDVRIRLWRACSTSEQVRGLGASYVYRTATSAALDLLRRRRAHGADLTDPVNAHSGHLTSNAGATEALDAGELERQVLAALELLPLSRRMVVRMYLSGYEREEIGELLGWSEAKTRNLLYRGLVDLRAKLMKLGITAGERT